MVVGDGSQAGPTLFTTKTDDVVRGRTWIATRFTVKLSAIRCLHSVNLVVDETEQPRKCY
jgi:hypothetical protein